MGRTELINKLIEANNFESYLEIGLGRCRHFRAVKAKHKIGVDPHVSGPDIVTMGSNEFFTHIDEKLDIIFIDGDHTAEQVENDIINSWKALNEGGYILIHDIDPPTKESQEVPKVSSPWKGTVWRAWIGFMKKYPEIDACSTHYDTGLGIIRKHEGDSEKVVEHGFISKIKYETFDKDRDKYLNWES